MIRRIRVRGRPLLIVALVASAAFAAVQANSLRATLTSASAPGGGGTTTAAGAAGHAQSSTAAAGNAAASGDAGGQTSGSATQQSAALPSTVAHLPSSDKPYVSEPSLTIDHSGNLYVTGPTGINPGGNFVTSPLWKSTDKGTTFTGPVTTTNAGPEDASLGGGDSDIIIDNSGNIFVTSLWLGNTSTSVSSDAGATWTGIPYAHPQPADDRPWYAYDPAANALYMTWDGFDGLHVGKALIKSAAQNTAAEPVASLFFAQDVIAVPEDATGDLSGQDQSIRNCACPPGGITVDPSGNVFVIFSRQSGPGIGGAVGVAESTNGGLTWTQTSVPNSGVPAAGPMSAELIFPQIHADAAGNVYAVWAQAISDNNSAVQVYYSYLAKGTTMWSDPVRVSVTHDALMPAFAVVAPGVLDVAYYGTNDYAGNSETAPKSTSWSVYLAQLTGALGVPQGTTNVALTDFHAGSICTSGLTCSTTGVDRSLGDFFSIVVDSAGTADIVTDDQRSGQVGVSLIHQTAPLVAASATVPASPAAAFGPPASVFSPRQGLGQPQPAAAGLSVASGSASGPPTPAATSGPLAPGLSLSVPASAAQTRVTLPPDGNVAGGGRLPLGAALGLFGALVVMALLSRGLRKRTS